MSNAPHLSVVVPAYNEAGAIGQTLIAMRAFLEDQGYAYEVILAADGDDATPDIAAEVASEWPALRVAAERLSVR